MAKTRNLRVINFPHVLLVILIVVSGVLLSFSTRGFVFNVKEIGFSIFSSAQMVIVRSINFIQDGFTAVSDLARLKEEHALLTEKLEKYEFMQHTNAQILKENERLNNILGFTQHYSYKSTAARIVGRDPDSLYSSLTIDKGSRDGIEKNMPVVAIQDGTVGIVGKVISVGPFTSFIMPVYDFNSHISARIQNTRDLGLVSGNGDLNASLTLNYINGRVANDLQYGDLVVSSGENANYMREISIGTISKIEKVDYDTSLIISLTPTINFSRLEEVLIIDTGVLNVTGSEEGSK